MIENSTRPAEALSLTPGEAKVIQKRVEFELIKMVCKAIKLGGFTNIIAGVFVVVALWSSFDRKNLLIWYGVLLLMNIINMTWAYWYEYGNATPKQLETWLKKARYIWVALCLTWGSLGVFFISGNIYYQFYIFAFLLAVLIGFTFGSVTDFIGSFVCIISLLAPSIVYRIYLGTHSLMTMGQDADANLAIGIALLILGIFLLIADYIGNRWIKKFFILSFENVALSHKLENMNKFLEQRVRERTIDLENSLKYVTFQATHDLLTELPNARLLADYMDEAIEKASKQQYMFAVICFTLNEIERINDGLGHQIGDFVIKTVAQRFQKWVSTQDASVKYRITLSRKDIFVLLAEPISKVNEIEKKCEKIFSILDEPIYTEQQVIRLTASIGVSLFPRNGRDSKSLLMNADAAMLRAKLQGGNSINMYKSDINADISKQLEMEIHLHNAIKNEEFTLHFQPFIDLQTGGICGMEALVRWESPVLGMISPMDFIPLAEANGMIIPLGEWVFRTACKHTKNWHELGFPLKIAINLSAKQLLNKNIVESIRNIIKEVNLAPEHIELELTESEAFRQEVIPILKKFKAMGFGLSIDDFGTGYSGLSNLKLFEIDKLKIDQSFIRDIVTNADSQAIVSNTITLAKKLNIKILAEGVETREQMEFLKAHGCDMIQGYYFSPPVKPEVFTELLKNKVQLH